MTITMAGSEAAEGLGTESPGAASPSSAAKALAILDVFSGPRALLGVTEVARVIGVPKSTAHRLLAVMIESGYIHKIDGRYALSERVFELGNRVGVAHVRATGLRHRAMPFLADLYVTTRETIHLATLSGSDVLYLEKLFGPSAARCSTVVGARRPAHATALGKAILAFSDERVLESALQVPFARFTTNTVCDPSRLMQRLDEVRAAGVATDHGEMHLDVHCIAAPILDPRSGRAVAAVSICSRTNRHLETRFTQVLQATARDLSRVPRSAGTALI